MLAEPQLQVRSLINQGVELAKSESYVEAAEVLREAATRARLGSFQDEELQALLTLSVCYNFTDQTKVRLTLDRALDVAKNLGDLVAQGKCYLNLTGVTEDRLQAINQLRLALSAFEQSGHKLGCAQALDNLAVCYRVIGSSRQGAAYASRARAMFRELDDPFGYAKNLRLSGDLLTDIVDEGLESDDLRERARVDYAEAMRLFHAIGAPTSYASCQDALGLLERSAGNLDAAIAHHQQALRILTRDRAPNLHSSGLLHLASTYREAGRLDDALQLYPAIIELKTALKDDEGVLNALHNQSVIRIDKGEYKAARDDLAVLIEQRFRRARSIYYPQTSGGLLSEYANAWSSFILASTRLIGQPPDRSTVIGLLVLLEQSKFNVMGRGMSVVPDAGIDSTGTRTRILRQELSLRRRHRAVVLSRQLCKTALERKKISKAAYDKKIDRLIARGYALINRLHEFYAHHPPKAVDADFKSYCRGIERGVRDAVTTLSAGTSPDAVHLQLFQFAGRNEILAAAITRYDCHLMTANLSANMLRALRADYHQVLASPPGLHWEKSLSALSERLGEILHRLELVSLLDGTRPVVLVASSMWQAMPWQIATLGSNYLGTQCAFTRSLSLASPALSDARPQVGAARPARKAHLYSPSAPDLAHSSSEVDALEPLLAGSEFEVSIFKDSAASIANLTEHSLGARLNILHFAGHSEFDAIDSGLSRIILSKRREAANSWLTAVEIESMRPPRGPKLVYLSSCSSGMVENRPGDEPIGLVKAFTTLGCEAFVCTSWATLDSSAKDLSAAFYEALIQRNTVAESARLARCQALKWSTAGKYPEKASIVHWGPLMTFSRPHFKLT